MDGTETPQVTPAQVLAGLQAALAYCRAMVAVRGELLRSERTALRWTQLSEQEFAGAWATATRAQLDAAAWLSRALSRYLEGGESPQRAPTVPRNNQRGAAVDDDCDKAESQGTQPGNVGKNKGKRYTLCPRRSQRRRRRLRPGRHPFVTGTPRAGA
jgi:hypothetical protein